MCGMLVDNKQLLFHLYQPVRIKQLPDHTVITASGFLNKIGVTAAVFRKRQLLVRRRGCFIADLRRLMQIFLGTGIRRLYRRPDFFSIVRFCPWFHQRKAAAGCFCCCRRLILLRLCISVCIFSFVRTVFFYRFCNCLQTFCFERLRSALQWLCRRFLFGGFFCRRHFLDQVFLLQRMAKDLRQLFVNTFALLKPDFHFRRMYINVDHAAVHLDMQDGKRILVFH